MNTSFQLPTLKCLRCDHKWIPRKQEQPRTCPKCKSPYWNVTRKAGRGKV